MEMVAAAAEAEALIGRDYSSTGWVGAAEGTEGISRMPPLPAITDHC